MAAAAVLKSEPLTSGRAEPLVRFSGVRKSYDGASLVVKDLDLEIARGEFLTLLGPSGSGKTTTLMMLAGFEPPTSGRITLGGRDITALPPHKRGIGMVFQNYALFPHMTVAENVAYPLAVRGVVATEKVRRVEAALDMVKLGGFGGRRPAELSGGQQQRVALARALVFEPEVLLLDEPLGALDKQLRERMQYELISLHERLGVTMVYVTHDQSEALTMSDRIAVFNDGRIQQLAGPIDLYERPSNAFVAGFVGENNRLTGSVTESRNGGVTVRLDHGREIAATPAAALRAGDRALLSIRPERLHLGSEPADNTFICTVERLVYLGDTARLIVRLGAEELVLKTDSRTTAETIARGTQVTVGCSAADCLAFAAEAP
jgi:putative spermidine/putrescine transport system ATP-binding protein